MTKADIAIATEMHREDLLANAIVFAIQNCKDYSDDDLGVLSCTSSIHFDKAREAYRKIDDLDVEDLPKQYQKCFKRLVDADHRAERRSEEIATGLL